MKRPRCAARSPFLLLVAASLCFATYGSASARAIRIDLRVSAERLDDLQVKALTSCISGALARTPNIEIGGEAPELVLDVEGARCETDPRSICAISVIALGPVQIGQVRDSLIEHAGCNGALTEGYLSAALKSPFRMLMHSLHPCKMGGLDQCCADAVSDLNVEILKRQSEDAVRPAEKTNRPAEASRTSVVQERIPAPPAIEQNKPLAEAPRTAIVQERIPAPPASAQDPASCTPTVSAVKWSNSWFGNKVTATATIENRCRRGFKNPTVTCRAYDSEGLEIGKSASTTEDGSVDPGNLVKVVRIITPAHGGVAKVTCGVEW